MYEMDPKALDRAQKLVKDARKKTWKYVTVGAMKRGWASWRERNTKLGFTARALLTGGTAYGATVAGAAAAAAIGSATVIASVASFGIGPVIVGLVGFGVKKGIDEFSYQRASRKVKAAIKKGKKPDIELIVPLTRKILKKLSRVSRRRDQLRDGFFGRKLAKLRHARTTFSAWRKKKKGLYHGHTEFSDIADPELYERLMELRYYGQIAFNLVHHLMDSVITVRDQYAAAMNQVFVYTIRQVHVFGEHDSCGDKCYTISKSDWEKQLRKLEHASKTGVKSGHTQFSHKTTQGLTARFESSLKKKIHTRKAQIDASTLLARIEKAGQDIDKVDSGEGTVTSFTKGVIKSEIKRRGIKDPLYKATKVTTSSKGGFGDLVTGSYKVTELSGTELAKQTGRSLMGGVLDLALDEVTTFAKNKWTRRKVLKTKDAGLGLLEATNESGNEAFTEVYKKILKKKSAPDQLLRLSEKVIHYYQKMDSMDENFREHILKPMKFWGTPKFKDMSKDPESPFDSCSQAWFYNNIGFHVFNNYNKYLVHLIYFEALLLNIDKIVTKKLPEIVPGSVIKTGQPDWPKPPHLAKRHGDLPLTSDSHELEVEEEEEHDEEEEEDVVHDVLYPMRKHMMKK